MLAMTEAAAEAINVLTAQEGQQEAGGLRFALRGAHDESAQLAVSVAPAPEEGDQVVGSDAGAKVFLVNGLINDCGRIVREGTVAELENDPEVRKAYLGVQ